jgi:CRP-like cAMP-binding protein
MAPKSCHRATQNPCTTHCVGSESFGRTPCRHSGGVNRLAEPLRLCRGETLLVGAIRRGDFARLAMAAGVVRLSASFPQTLSDVTLAFSGPYQPELLRLDRHRPYLLEAITDVEFTLSYGCEGSEAMDLISCWLLRFHLIRHHLAADQRINQLLCDLTQEFGLRTPEGYRLPFLLAHARVAEVVGSTRSTVTRQLMRLRDDGYLRTEESKRQMTFTDSFCAEFCCG